jgi:hypothetical protein
MYSQRLGLILACLSLLSLSFSCNENAFGVGVFLDGDTDADGGADECVLQPDSATRCWLDGSLNGSIVNPSCPSDMPTTLTGVVTIPAGTLPVANARVYIAGTPAPDDATAPSNLEPIVHGATCTGCDQLVPADAVASALTDVGGRFTLTGVPYPPDGKAMYLVIRLGKWRRAVRIENSDSQAAGVAKLSRCATTTLDKSMMRLPRTQSEGDIPRIALSTGSADALECLLRGPKLGLADSEFTTENGKGSVNLYAGNGTAQFNKTLGGARFTAAQKVPTPSWWDTQANWNKYDAVLLSCEGDPNYSTKSVTARANLQTYINQGGRVLAMHWHNGWMEMGPAPLSKVASFAQKPANPVLNNGTASVDIVTSFRKGGELKQWLANASALTSQGQLLLKGAKNTILTLNTRVAQPWLTFGSGSSLVYQYFTFRAPIGVEPSSQCGEMAFTDLQASTGVGDTSGPGIYFPDGCRTTSMAPQEEALIYMLLDLTSCLPGATL